MNTLLMVVAGYIAYRYFNKPMREGRLKKIANAMLWAFVIFGILSLILYH